MKFHEDLIFKSEGKQYGQELIKIMNIKGKIIKTLPTEYSEIKPKTYKPDLVFELEDKIIILEFQSTNVNLKDQRRFRLYTALVDSEIIKSTKSIELHVLSTFEKEKTKIYQINQDSRFHTYIHSLQTYNGDEFLNKMKKKINKQEIFSKKELLMISLMCFMTSKNNIEQTILNSAETIANIKCLEDDIAQFIKGTILILCNKFVKDEKTNKNIRTLVGERMKVIDDYINDTIKERIAESEAKVKEAEKKLIEKEKESQKLIEKEKEAEKKLIEKEKESQKKLIEKEKEIIINLNKEGLSIETIAKILNVNLDFVKQTLSP
jgi:hypothetical protein